MTDIIDRLKEPEAHYPGNFDTPKRANAMLSCLCQEAMEEIESLRRELKHMTDEYHAALEAEHVRYRQVVEKNAEIARLYRDQEQYGPDKVAIEKQAWVEADRQRQINELRKQLAEKEAEIERLKEEQAELIRRFQNENCGQTFMGEPVIQDRPVPAKQYMAAVNGRRAFRSQVIELRQQLAASQAREQQLREKVSELINAAPGHAGQCSGLKCREPYCYSCNDEDEADKYLQQVWDLCHSARELLKQTNTIALEAMIAKAGEVMRERCAVRADWFTPFVGGKIRALPAVTIDDLKCSN